MADSANIVVRTVQNGFRNIVIRAALTSDGSGLTNYKVYDATSATWAVNVQGQTFKPGIYTKLVGLDYDVQDLKIQLLWDATTPEQIFPLGSAPEDFDWRSAPLAVPSGLAGATGSILLSTLNAVPNGTFFVILRLWKCVPQT